MLAKSYTHVGMVVTDLQATMAALGPALGVKWASVLSWKLDLWTPAGVVRAQSTFTYAMGDGPSIELLQEELGTVWTVGSATAHHLGYWSTDMEGDAEQLRANGYEMIATLDTDEGGPSGFSYHAGPAHGPLIELVDATLQPRFDRWWGGGRF